jgi:hypothetical protein
LRWRSWAWRGYAGAAPARAPLCRRLQEQARQRRQEEAQK